MNTSRQTLPPGAPAKRYLLLICGCLTALIGGISLTQLCISLLPIDRSLSLPVSFVCFPVLSGCWLLFSYMHQRPWFFLIQQVALIVLLVTLSFFISSWRWVS